jgi:hypothetical protein
MVKESAKVILDPIEAKAKRKAIREAKEIAHRERFDKTVNDYLQGLRERQENRQKFRQFFLENSDLTDEEIKVISELPLWTIGTALHAFLSEEKEEE